MPRAKGKTSAGGSSRQPSLPLTWPVPLEPQDKEEAVPVSGPAQDPAAPPVRTGQAAPVAPAPPEAPVVPSAKPESQAQETATAVSVPAKGPQASAGEPGPAPAGGDASAGPEAPPPVPKPEEVAVSSPDRARPESERAEEGKADSAAEGRLGAEPERGGSADAGKGEETPTVAEPESAETERPSTDDSSSASPPDGSTPDTSPGRGGRSGRGDRLKVRRGGVRLGPAKAAVAESGVESEAETDAAPSSQADGVGGGSVPEPPPVVPAAPPAAEGLPAAKGNEPHVGETPLPPAPDPGQPKVVKLGETVLSLGQILAEARGAQNLTIAQVAQKTLVPKEIIENLESDRIDKLPSAIYTRSHLVHLCEEYGVDKDPILADYDRRVAALGTATAGGDLNGMVMTTEATESASRVQWEPAGRGPVHSRGGPLSPTMWLVAAAAVLIVVLAMVALGVRQWRQRPVLPPGTDAGSTAATSTSTVNLDDYVAPQQLPLKELPVPKK